jgi:predicted transcriptional regulator
MMTLTLELSEEMYERLRAEAGRRGRSEEEVAREWLAERLNREPEVPPPAPAGERERMTEALRAAGLLTELSPNEKERARRSKATLEEVRAALDRAGGKPLSEVVLEMRGPKE